VSTCPTRLFTETNAVDFEKGLVPSADLKESAWKLKARRAELGGLEARAVKQSEIVRKASAQLEALLKVDAAKLKTPEAIRDAKRHCAEAGAQLKDEQDLLEAIEAAISNAKADCSEQAAGIVRSIERTVKGAAQRAEGEIKETIKKAVQDYVTCRVAVGGGQSYMGAQYELEMMAKDTSFLKSVDQRIAAAHRNLREALEASGRE
jgi:hypothetical protein